MKIRKTSVLVVSLLSMASVTTASAALLAYEGFSIGAGAYAAGQIAENWTTGRNVASTGFSSANPWLANRNDTQSAQHGQVITTGLTYGGLVVSGGALVVNGSNTFASRVGRLLTPSASLTDSSAGPRYISFLLNFPVVDGDPAQAQVRFHRAPTATPTTFGGTLPTFDDSPELAFGIGSTFATNPSILANPTLTADDLSWGVNNNFPRGRLVDGVTAGSSYLVVVRLEMSATTLQDRVTLWVNPADLSSEALSPATIAQFTNTGTGGDLAFDRLSIIRAASSNISEGIIFDELRIGDTWADVVPIPEPTTITMLIGLAGLFGLSRRHA